MLKWENNHILLQTETMKTKIISATFHKTSNQNKIYKTKITTKKEIGLQAGYKGKQETLH